MDTELLMEKVAQRSRECQRGIVAEGVNANGVVICGVVLIAPDSLMAAHLLAPDFIYDYHYN